MPRYRVSVPLLVHVSATIEADDEDAAIDAFDSNVVFTDSMGGLSLRDRDVSIDWSKDNFDFNKADASEEEGE